MRRPIFDPEDARPFWEERYAAAPVYGFEPTSLAPRLAALFRVHRVKRLLDAGCGSGRDALYYAEQGFDVTGIDLSANALRWAKQRAAELGVSATFLEDDLTQTRLAPASFDACVAVHLIHLHPAHLRQRLVNQLWQTTRSGGIVAMANYSTREAGFDTWEVYPEPNTRVDPKSKLIHFFAAGEFENLLPPDRFELLTLEEVDLAEVPDTGPVTHREWLAVARKIQPRESRPGCGPSHEIASPDCPATHASPFESIRPLLASQCQRLPDGRGTPVLDFVRKATHVGGSDHL